MPIVAVLIIPRLWSAMDVVTVYVEFAIARNVTIRRKSYQVVSVNVTISPVNVTSSDYVRDLIMVVANVARVPVNQVGLEPTAVA